MATWVESNVRDPKMLMAFQREYTISDATELICAAMEETNVKRSELAVRLGTTKGYITQLLDGHTNMTLATLSDVFTVLGLSVHLSRAPLTFHLAQGDSCPHDDITFHWKVKEHHDWPPLLMTCDSSYGPNPALLDRPTVHAV